MLKVMLHYVKAGTQRSPNDQADLIRSCQYLNERCEFITLNQTELPSKIGHIESIKRLYKEIRRHKPDIIHIIGVKEGFHCAIAARLANVQKRILITRGFAGYTKSLPLLQRLIYRWIIEPFTITICNKVHCNSLFSFQSPMIRQCAARKSEVVYNFLNIVSVQSGSPWRKSLGFSEDDFIVVTIGNFHNGKGYDVLQKVIDYYKDNQNVKFIVIGDGGLKKSFDSLNANNYTSGRVMALGGIPHNKAMQVLSEANLFYLPTRFESLGMVFAEASAYGVPSIGTDVGGVPELVENNVTGFLNPIDDAESAITQIDYLYRNPSVRHEMGQHAKNKVMRMFDSSHIGQQIFELFYTE